MKVQLLYFASLKTITGKSHDDLELPQDSSIKELHQRLKEKYSGFTDLRHLAIAINDEYVPSHIKLKEGDTVCFVPPVCGG